MAAPVSPKAWRTALGLSQAEAARKVGVAGKNPARTWQRWESGQLEPPLGVIIAVERISGGKVLAISWAGARLSREHQTRKCLTQPSPSEVCL